MTGDAAALWELSSGEMFPLGALLARRGVTSVYRATQDTFCLAFPVAVFDAPDRTRRRCSRTSARAASRTCSTCRAPACRPSTRRPRPSSAVSPHGLATLVRQAPIACRPAGAARRGAARRWRSRRIGSMPIVDARRAAAGHLHAAGRHRARRAAAATARRRRSRDVMSAPAITLPADGDGRRRRAADGATRHPARASLVDDDGVLAGVVSERDLFSLQRLSVRELASAIRARRDVAGAGPVRGRHPRAVATRWSRRAWRRASSRG